MEDGDAVGEFDGQEDGVFNFVADVGSSDVIVETLGVVLYYYLAFAFGLVLLQQSRLQALKEFVYLGREGDTEAASTSFWLWKMVTQLENLMARKTGCLTLWRMLGAVM